jgi:predicted DNA-binding transcriptional regulator AlpA
MTKNLINPKQLAELFAINENTIAKWRVQGNDPKFVKIQRRIRYAAYDVDHWMNERTFASTTAADASLKFGGAL